MLVFLVENTLGNFFKSEAFLEHLILRFCFLPPPL